jgi:carbonic anhydrase
MTVCSNKTTIELSSCMTEYDRAAESDLRNRRYEEAADSPATWSHIDSSKPITKTGRKQWYQNVMRRKAEIPKTVTTVLP